MFWHKLKWQPAGALLTPSIVTSTAQHHHSIYPAQQLYSQQWGSERKPGIGPGVLKSFPGSNNGGERAREQEEEEEEGTGVAINTITIRWVGGRDKGRMRNKRRDLPGSCRMGWRRDSCNNMAMEGVNINQRRRGAELENVVGGGRWCIGVQV